MTIQKIMTKNCKNMENKRNEYIVIHYTGNPGTTARQNALYFQSTENKVSAHYVVDSNEIYQCVDDSAEAWHVGGKPYAGTTPAYYKKCTNQNSIGIEICCIKENDKITYSPKAIMNALALTYELMNKYEIPISRVIRHMDVTGKICPANFDFNEFKKELREMNENSNTIESLKNELEILRQDVRFLNNEITELKKHTKIYRYWSELQEIPDGGESYRIIHTLYERGIYKGASSENLSLTDDIRRMLIFNARAGLYGDI